MKNDGLHSFHKRSLVEQVLQCSCATMEICYNDIKTNVQELGT